MKTFAMGIFAVLALASLGAPVPEAAEAEPGLLAQVRALALERSGGDLTRLGVQVTHGPEGAVEQPITGEEFLARVAFAAERGSGAQADDFVHAEAIGYAIQNTQLQQRLGWPFCDSGSMFAMHFGPGSAIVHADRSPTGDVATSPICGGFYGATHTWSDITFDIRGMPGAYICGGAMIMMPPALPPLSQQGSCGWTVACFAGNAALTSLSFFGIRMEYVLMGSGYVVLGHDRTDGPACAPMLPVGMVTG